MALKIFESNLSPSVTDTIQIDGQAFNLTGSTVKFRMRAAGSATLKVDAAATIVSAIAGTVRYDWLSGDTNTPDNYVFWWTVTLSNGEEQDTPETDLIIAQHAQAEPYALCTLFDVHLAMETPETDTSLDDVAQEYINEASATIIKEYNREFAPVTTNATRRFLVEGTRVNLMPYDLQFDPRTQTPAVTVVLDPEQAATTLTIDDWEPRPFVNSEGVYTVLKISPWIAQASLRKLKFGSSYVDITATWGFASVPEPVKRACVVTVRTWLRKDAQRAAGSIGGEYYSGQELSPDMYTTYALPAAARRLLERYRRDIGVA